MNSSIKWVILQCRYHKFVLPIGEGKKIGRGKAEESRTEEWKKGKHEREENFESHSSYEVFKLYNFVKPNKDVYPVLSWNFLLEEREGISASKHRTLLSPWCIKQRPRE